MYFAAKGRLQGRAAKLLLARWQSWCYGRCLTANGPAVWLVADSARALAGSPIDFVSVAGCVMVHDNLISVFNLSYIVFLVKM
jgi:hypothetical protein